jgi:RNA polymerase sigma factor (sigma-70 family)
VEGRPLDEAQLIARARRGDEEAYAALVTHHSDLAFRIAYLLTGSATDAKEATQDGFLAAYRALPRFRSDAPLRPWLLRIIANAARNHRRASRRRADLELRVIDQFRHGDAAPSPEAAVEAAEERAALLRAVNSLERERPPGHSVPVLPGPRRGRVRGRHGLRRGHSQVATFACAGAPP